MSRTIDVVVRPPGSKSLTIRAMAAAAMAGGESRLVGALIADDTRTAAGAMEVMGVSVQVAGDTIVVTGGPLRPGAVDAGESGLTARIVMAMAALASGATTITGRGRLPQRPMRRLIDALAGLDVSVDSRAGRLPVVVHGRGGIPGGTVAVSVAESTQFATALLLIGPRAGGPLTVTTPGLEGAARGYLDLTIQVMEVFGAGVTAVPDGYRVEPTGYQPATTRIEPDASAAVYPMVAAALTGGRVVIEGLDGGTRQPDFRVAQILEMMGCKVDRAGGRTVVSGPPRLEPVDVVMSDAPDGSLAVAVACALARGPSRIRGLGSLRLKESERLSGLARELSRVGCVAEVKGDDLILRPGVLRPATVETYGDHRMAMAFGLLRLVQPDIEVADPGVVAKTWPQYWEFLAGLTG